MTAQAKDAPRPRLPLTLPAKPLARARISIFAISTYDTDYVLVKGTDLDAAIAALEGAGHRVTRAAP